MCGHHPKSTGGTRCHYTVLFGLHAAFLLTVASKKARFRATAARGQLTLTLPRLVTVNPIMGS